MADPMSPAELAKRGSASLALGHGPLQTQGGPPPPIDPAVGNPLAKRGISSPIADWVLSQASAAINGVRRLKPAPRAAASTSTALVTTTPPQQMQPAISGPGSGPVPGTPFRRPDGRLEPVWFGPGTPQTPMAPWADVAGRAFDYNAGYNMGSKPRQLEGVTFEQLRGLANNLDIARLAIETRKDQLERCSWSILPIQQPGEMTRAKADDRCRMVEKFLRRPDRRHTFAQWMRMLLEDQMVIDAASIYVRKTKGGDVYSLDVVDGALIKPLLDKTGRAPMAPAPAYQQVLKGMPAVEYTTDELIYAPRNPRSNHVYGLSNIEQIMVTINIAIRREVVKLKYFTENNMPEAIASTPAEWGPEQVAKFQVIWDSLMKAKNEAGIPGMKFIPGAAGVQFVRSDAMLMGQFDEWIARVTCFCFSLAPTAFVQQQNRATAETAKDSALEEGLAPWMTWFKGGVMDRIVQDSFGYDDLEFVWDDIKQISVEQERMQDRADYQAGIVALDEIRAKRGLDPVGLDKPFVMGGPSGVMFADDLAEAHAQGLLKIQPPAPPVQYDELGNPIPQQPGMAMPGAMPGAAGAGDGTLATNQPPPQQLEMPPSRQGNPAAAPGGSSTADILAGIPSDILQMVGLGEQGAGGRGVDVTRNDEIQSDPEVRFAAHPQVLATLRDAEARQKGRYQ